MPLAIVHHPQYQAPLRPDHRFPMSKYGYLREALIARGLLAPGGYVAPGPASAAMLSLAHDPDYVSRAFALTLTDREMKRIGLPKTERVILRARLAAAGSALAGRIALTQGVACNTAGGSHHAGPEHGAGFSTFNDVAVAIRALQKAGLIGRALVVDCDVHQGDGTAKIFADDPSVFTFSIHCGKNYPFTKAISDLDVALEDGTEDAPYLTALEAGLETALAAGRYDLAYYNAGVDVHRLDRLGRLALSDEGIRARDRLVLGRLRAAGLPVATAIGGGYDDDPERLATRHAIVFEEAARLVAPAAAGEAAAS
ncbi:MAG: histone deacetylase [Pseudomonadota bacterium]